MISVIARIYTRYIKKKKKNYRNCMERKLFGSIQNWIKIKIQLSDIFETQTDKN